MRGTPHGSRPNLWQRDPNNRKCPPPLTFRIKVRARRGVPEEKQYDNYTSTYIEIYIQVYVFFPLFFPFFYGLACFVGFFHTRDASISLALP